MEAKVAYERACDGAFASKQTTRCAYHERTVVNGLVYSLGELLRQEVVDVDQTAAARHALHGHSGCGVRFLNVLVG